MAAAFYLVAIFHRMSLGVASLDASERFGVSTSAIALLSTVQLGVYLAMQIPAGLLADRLGPRRSLTLGLLAMGVGELLFAFSPALGRRSRGARWWARVTPACSSTSCGSPRTGSRRAGTPSPPR